MMFQLNVFFVMGVTDITYEHTLPPALFALAFYSSLYYS